MEKDKRAKGATLEKAVRLIQKAILESDPRFVGVESTIEQNKIEVIAGVRHEIDVCVKTLPGSQFEAVWIFECKNWNKPVGKNEVIVLAEKVKATAATMGFLVAREFTRDAEAQAKQDRRLRLLPCTDEFLSPLSLRLVEIVHDLEPVRIGLKQRGVPALSEPAELDWRTVTCRMNGDNLDFCGFVKHHVDQMVQADRNENQAKYNDPSSHFSRRSLLIRFDEPMEFVANEMDVEHMCIDVRCWVTVQERKLISKFELQKQGRAFSFEPIHDEVAGKAIEIDVVQRI